MTARFRGVLAAVLMALALAGCDLDDDPKRDAPVVNVPADPSGPPAMRPCEELQAPDADPAAGPPSGRTCRLGAQVLTFADPETTVAFGGIEAQLAGVGPAGLKSPEVYDILPNPRKARTDPQPITSKSGQFLALRLKLENKADEPLDALAAGLVVGGTLYARDPRNAFYVDRETPPLPLAPGDSGELLLLFDLPRSALAGLTSPDTALALVDPRNQASPPVGPGSSPTVTRLRLFK